MSGLLGLLHLGANAIQAHNAGIATVGRNTANVNTPGYSREEVDLRSELGAPLVGGVRAGELSRAEDRLLATRERATASELGAADARANALTGLERELVPRGDDLVSQIGALFSSFTELAGLPSSEPLRAKVVAAAGAVAERFAAQAGALDGAQRDADARIGDAARQATALMSEIAAANRALTVERDPVLADKRDLAARELAELTGAQARLDPDGQMRVTLDGGLVLVDGGEAYALEAVSDPARGGLSRLELVDGARRDDVTSRVAGGRIAGELAFRDGDAARARADLDQLAFDFVSSVNAVHRSYAGLDGVAGRDLFVAPGAVSGAAAAAAVDPSIDADPRRVAAATVGAGPGDQAGALALAALRDAPIAAAGTRTAGDEAIRLLSAVGRGARDLGEARDLAAARTDALAAVRDGLSGVSTQDELQRLAAFQHAAEAATRFLSTVNDLLDQLVRNL
jgi:flagellar hook-associated protein 1 FlgK